MNTTVVSYPRIGKQRELKFAIEKYWKGKITESELILVASELKKEHLYAQKNAGITNIPCNDFSFYDGMLDLAVMLNVIPKEYKELELSELDTYFSMARGYQGDRGDVKALAMKKWFNTNYHYIVPELYDDMEIKLNASKLLDEYKTAKKLGINARPVTIGAFTFLKLAAVKGNKSKEEYTDKIVAAFSELLNECAKEGVEWVQIDEPALILDMDDKDLHLFMDIYKELLVNKGNVKVLIQTYFGDVRDCYSQLSELNFDGIGLDFIEGKQNLSLIEKYGFPSDKRLFAGVINGKNIWKCDYEKALETITEIRKYSNDTVISTSCSLLHVPYTVQSEEKLTKDVLDNFAFAEEKLEELCELALLADNPRYPMESAYKNNITIVRSKRGMEDIDVRKKVASITESDFKRSGNRSDRQRLQREVIGIPTLATTTIGSFPQTKEVKHNRNRYKSGEISKEKYDEQVFNYIKQCVRLQEDIGLDILVHGEYERNDMVEFFGENFKGYVFTEFAWVQSYGTRCVKPPIIFGDVKREQPITVKYTSFANNLTEKQVKGMLTGPVTILNWSFPREDISLKEMAFQIGLAIREEVLDLEAAGIQIIQIDEAALREKLPLRKEEWHSEYLDWALQSFRLCHSGVKPETQIHTHMCYSEFEDIIKEIDEMDADVITFEASRSKLTILDSLNEAGFETEVGPGVYDIHSPRVPSVDEIVNSVKLMLTKISKDKLWINPDCGLKTRGAEETTASLKNLVAAADIVRKELKA